MDLSYSAYQDASKKTPTKSGSGDLSYDSFNAAKTATPQPSFLQRAGSAILGGAQALIQPAEDAFKGGVQQAAQGIQEGGLPGAFDVASGITTGVTSPLASLFAPVSKGVELAGNAISDIPAVQKFAAGPHGEQAIQAAQDESNLMNIAGTVLGGVEGVKGFAKGEVKPTETPEVPGAPAPTAAKPTDLSYSNFKQSNPQPQAPEVAQPTEAPTQTLTPSEAPAQGATPSKIGKSVEAKAVEAKLTQGFSNTAGYDPITIKDQSERATALLNDSHDTARAVIRGDQQLPEGLKGTALITAAEEHLAEHPDAQFAYELANSPLISETSGAAQELRLAAERQPDSITAMFNKVKELRQAALEKQGGARKVTKQVTDEMKKEISTNASKRPSWEDFIKEVQCNY